MLGEGNDPTLATDNTSDSDDEGGTLLEHGSDGVGSGAVDHDRTGERGATDDQSPVEPLGDRLDEISTDPEEALSGPPGWIPSAILGVVPAVATVAIVVDPGGNRLRVIAPWFLGALAMMLLVGSWLIPRRTPAVLSVLVVSAALATGLSAGLVGLDSWTSNSDQPATSVVDTAVLAAPTATAGAHLVGADLDGASLDGATLDGADIRAASAIAVQLSGASLREADFRGADLRGAIITDACLRGADLRGALLAGVQLSGSDLSNVRFDAEAADLIAGAVAADPSPCE